MVEAQNPLYSFNQHVQIQMRTLQQKSLVFPSIGFHMVSCVFWQMKKEQNLNFPQSSSAANPHLQAESL